MKVKPSKSIAYLVAGAAALAVSVWAAWLLFPGLSTQAEPDTAARTIAPAVPSTTVMAPTLHRQPDELATSPHVVALTREVATLRRELAALKGQLAAQARRTDEIVGAMDALRVAASVRPSGPSHDAEPDEPLPPDDAGLASRRGEANEVIFAGEQVDPQWSLEASGLLRDVFTQAAMVDSVLDMLECRATLCRIEVFHETAAARASFEIAFPMLVGRTLPSMAMQVEADPDGSSSSTVFLARDGHRLPQDGVTE